jgi:hypothetical protein
MEGLEGVKDEKIVSKLSESGIRISKSIEEVNEYLNNARDQLFRLVELLEKNG